MISEYQKGSFWNKLIWEVIYAIGTIVYLVHLNGLNNELKNINHNAFEIAMYHNGEPVIFVVIAFILLILGIALSWWTIGEMIFQEFDFWFVVLAIGSTLINLLLVILIICFINDPILRCVLFVAGVGVVTLYTINSN